MPRAGNGRTLVAFAALFLAYQAPEGVGQRLLGSFAVQALLLCAFFVVAYGVARLVGYRPLDAYGLERTRGSLRPFLLCFALAIVAKVTAVGLGLIFGVYQQGGTTPASVALPLATGLLMTFVPSIAEDIVTRGFWFRAAGVDWRPLVFVLATSGIYVANHVYRLGAGIGEWSMLFAFGVAYSLAVVRFQSLWPAVGLHWGWNYGNLAAGTLMPFDTASVPASRALSIGAHLVMAGIVAALTRTPRR